jgi:putative transcriptional regulator
LRKQVKSITISAGHFARKLSRLLAEGGLTIMSAGLIRVLKAACLLFIILLALPAPGQDTKPDRVLHAALSSTDKSSGAVRDLKPEYEKLAKGRFLVSNSRIQDRIFGRSVILLITHDQNGSMGLIINRQTDSKVADLLPDIKELAKSPDTLYFGGPVSLGSVFLLLRTGGNPGESEKVFDNIYISQSIVLLKRMADNSSPQSEFRLYAGYAGWAAGQLEAEVIRGDWIVVPADPEMVFDEDPAGIWDRLMPLKLSI